MCPINLSSDAVDHDILSGNPTDRANPIIVKLLKFRDLASLRCTSRAIESKASYGSFTKRFYHKNIKLETKTLHKLVRLSNKEYLTSRLKHCTIIGIPGHKEAPRCQINVHKQLLTTIFRNFRKNIQTSSMFSLTLRIDKHINVIEPLDMISALHTFEITMAALNHSNLSVDEYLNLFNSGPTSLYHTAFLSLAQRPGPAKAFKRLKWLEMRLSPYVAHGDWYSFVSHDERNQLSTLKAISHMSAIMPKLEGFHLHWLDCHHGHMWDLGTTNRPRYREITSGSPPLNLKECALSGMSISGLNLLQFIKSTSPEVLYLKRLFLAEGVLAKSPYPEHIFEKLFERRHIGHLSIPEKSDKANESITEIGAATLLQQMSRLGYEEIPNEPRSKLHPRAREYVRLGGYAF
ncbi:hypothetical protein FHL15_009374 [Xylaria flabelliformis]|uniref:F-box domain-containing protein n=1 Tax=Xylaria flabelliformis TaxID=2512241 RepID=A0A553HPA5_9PEZI|nr:hypothetical protein FHL15_009374 [Xylaria flabelliformis]